MRKRTKARECALKILYAMDITKDLSPKCSLAFWEDHPEAEKDVKEYSDFLVKGVSDNRELIDKTISRYATNWQIGRMATVDRNILRIAAMELLFSDNVPPKVSINEAVEIAKKYGDKDSGKFVNGVLDKISKSGLKDKK